MVEEMASKKAAVRVAETELEKAETTLDMFTLRSRVNGVIWSV